MKDINWTAIAVGFAPVVLQILVWAIGIIFILSIPVLIPIAIIVLILLPRKAKSK